MQCVEQIHRIHSPVHIGLVRLVIKECPPVGGHQDAGADFRFKTAAAALPAQQRVTAVSGEQMRPPCLPVAGGRGSRCNRKRRIHGGSGNRIRRKITDGMPAGRQSIEIALRRLADRFRVQFDDGIGRTGFIRSQAFLQRGHRNTLILSIFQIVGQDTQRSVQEAVASEADDVSIDAFEQMRRLFLAEAMAGRPEGKPLFQGMRLPPDQVLQLGDILFGSARGIVAPVETQERPRLPAERAPDFQPVFDAAVRSHLRVYL